MWNLQRVLPWKQIKFIRIELSRNRSNRRSEKDFLEKDKHIHHKRQDIKLDDNQLSPVVRQYLERNPSYTTRFGGKLSDDKKHLVRKISCSTGRAEHLLSQIEKEDLHLTINGEEKDLARPPVLDFPSAKNQYQFNLGTEDQNLVQYKDAFCFGCGALLQCSHRNQPGFFPSEIYRQYLSTNLQKRSSQCQRCFILKYTKQISNVEVNEQVYQDILREIRRKRALIILLVDLIDIPNSISQSWSHLIERNESESNQQTNIIFVLGNKIDLLPKDSENYLSNVLDCLKIECQKRGLGKDIVKYYGLISARTGFGIEQVISKIYRYWSQHGGVYLLGGTNAGKTSLFNSLMDSDLCHIHALDCIQRATVSNLPGTTMNVLTFPIQLRTGKNQFLRVERLKELKKNQVESEGPFDNETTKIETIRPTVKWRREFESEMNLPKSGLSYDYSSSQDSFLEDKSFHSSEQHYLNYRQKKLRAFNPSSYKNEKWLYDTPGVVLNEQIINKSNNNVELSYFDHQSTVIRPINIRLNLGQTILIGGIARIDVKQISENGQASVCLMTTSTLPVHVIETNCFDEFYKRLLEKNQLAVPQNRINGRLQDPPELMGPTIEILGHGEDQSAADIVLSSAGWISVQSSRNSRVVLDALTPSGVGIHLRQPSILKYLPRLCGNQIDKSPFSAKLVENDPIELKTDRFNENNDELEMIINEKLWKGEQINRQRRAKRS